jgi:hypothetical protein
MMLLRMLLWGCSLLRFFCQKNGVGDRESELQVAQFFPEKRFLSANSYFILGFSFSTSVMRPQAL